MPQMSPLQWMPLMIMNLTLLIIMTSIIFFANFNLPYNFRTSNSTKSFLKWQYKF